MIGSSLEALFELSGDAMLIYDCLPKIKDHLRMAVDSRQCRFSISALSCIEEYLKCVETFGSLFNQRVNIYREASKNNTTVVIFSALELDLTSHKDSRPEPLRFDERFGHPNTTKSDVEEFLFGIGIQERHLYADSRTLLLAVRRLVKLLLDVREICSQGLSVINALCPACGEHMVKEAVSYLKAQINAVNDREAVLEAATNRKVSHLKLVR